MIALRDEFPILLESEDLDMSTLEEIDLPMPPPEDLFAPPRALLPLSEEPVVRKSSLPLLPADVGVDSAEVIVDFLVTVDGRPAAVEVFAGDESFVQEALQAARQYVFFPAVDREGKKRRCGWRLRFLFCPAIDPTHGSPRRPRPPSPIRPTRSSMKRWLRMTLVASRSYLHRPRRKRRLRKSGNRRPNEQFHFSL